MAQNYSVLVSEIATLTAISSTVLESGDSNFQGPMPFIIDYAEGRLWRELDLPVASVVDTSVVCASGVRSISLSTTQGTLLVIESLNVFTPVGTTSSNATRVPLIPTSRAVVDAIYPTAVSSYCGVPQYFARIGDTQIIFGPTPDQTYRTEVSATTRPAALSASNSSTWLTRNVPEMMLAACMVSAAGYMRDFGAQSDNPQMAQSWETQYGNLMKSMNVDSMRMKFESAAWTSQQPAPLATPPRT